MPRKQIVQFLEDERGPFLRIQLTRGYHCDLDDEDADLTQVLWSAIANSRGRFQGGHRRSPNPEPNGYIHRHVLARKLGREIGEKMTDHIDGNPQNNRRYNLREATNRENQANRGATHNKKSGLPCGVARHYGGYRARLVAAFKSRGDAEDYLESAKKQLSLVTRARPYRGSRNYWRVDLHLGTFPTIKEASDAYDHAARILHGKFAKLNCYEEGDNDPTTSTARLYERPAQPDAHAAGG